MKKVLTFIVFNLLFMNVVFGQWQYLGPDGNTECICINGTTIFASSDSYLYKSTDGGNTWIDCNNGIPHVVLSYLVKSMVVLPPYIYAGTIWNPYRSSDNGENWTVIGSGTVGMGQYSMTVQDSIVFAGTAPPNAGVFYITPHDSVWTQANNGLTNLNVYSMVTDDSVIYAGTSFPLGGVFRSSDYAASWTLLDNGLPDSSIIQSLVARGNDIYAGTDNKGIFHSADYGSSWHADNIGLQELNVATIYFYGSYLLAGTKPSNPHGGFYRSSDGGSTWSPWSYGVPANPLNVYNYAVKDTFIYAATSTGVWRRNLSELTGIEETGINTEIAIFPNPAESEIHFTLPEKYEMAKVSIFNVVGKEVVSLKLDHAQNEIEINVQGLPQGVYFIRVKNLAGKFVKH